MTNLWKLSMFLSAVCITETAATEEEKMNHHGRKLIIGGEQAPKGRYPYFSTLNHDCGGVLIAPDVVLTAGHCLPGNRHDVYPHVGRYTFHEDEDDSIGYTISYMERHPRWYSLGDDEFRYDVSLLFLKTTVDIPYIRLNRDSNLPAPGQEITSMGVGITSNDWENAKRANTLRRVHLNYLPNDQCELSNNAKTVGRHEEVTRYEGRIHHDHLCTTGGPNNERDSCAYDSGSPMILEGNSPEEDVLVALVSWGEGCADPDFPGVNTRVSDLIDFIESTVCEHSLSPPADFKCAGSTEQPTEAPTKPPTEAPTSSPTEAPTSSPTEAPTTPPPPTTTIFSPLMLSFLVACVVAASLYWIRRRPVWKQTGGEDEEGDFLWLPDKEPHLERRQTTETEYLYQNSPASSRGSRTSYDAIETMDV